MNGVLVVDKPVGPTSHDVVAVARRTLRERRIGHTGTLDPLASGVLALVVGQATRLSKYLTASDKEYDATVTFGVETDSYDAAGAVLAESGQVPSEDALRAALDPFRGAFDQRPPIFSAKKVDGDRAYDLARRDGAVDLKPVPVTVHRLELVRFEPPRAVLHLVCSAGFYVRSLAHDLGAALGTGAMLSGLRRTRSGAFGLDDAVPLDRFADAAARVIPMERLMLDVPAAQVTRDGLKRVAHGQDIRPADVIAGLPASAPLVRLLGPDGAFLALAEPAKTPGFLHPTVVFS